MTKQTQNSKKPGFISPTSGYPLLWPLDWQITPASQRKVPKDNITHFLTAYDYTLKELETIQASNILVSCNLPINQRGEYFIDFLDRKLDDPGVAVYFFVDGNPYCIACDSWEYPKDNLRSIGLAIGHMRSSARNIAPHFLQKILSAFAVHAPEFKSEASPQKHYFHDTIPEIESYESDPIPEQQNAQKTPARFDLTMDPKQWWLILDVPENAGLSEIEAAFKSLARLAHPDRGGDVNNMQLINMAVTEARQSYKNKRKSVGK